MLLAAAGDTSCLGPSFVDGCDVMRTSVLIHSRYLAQSVAAALSGVVTFGEFWTTSLRDDLPAYSLSTPPHANESTVEIEAVPPSTAPWTSAFTDSLERLRTRQLRRALRLGRTRRQRRPLKSTASGYLRRARVQRSPSPLLGRVTWVDAVRWLEAMAICHALVPPGLGDGVLQFMIRKRYQRPSSLPLGRVTWDHGLRWLEGTSFWLGSPGLGPIQGSALLETACERCFAFPKVPHRRKFRLGVPLSDGDVHPNPGPPKVVTAAVANDFFDVSCFVDGEASMACSVCACEVASTDRWKFVLKRHINGNQHLKATSSKVTAAQQREQRAEAQQKEHRAEAEEKERQKEQRDGYPPKRARSLEPPGPLIPPPLLLSTVVPTPPSQSVVKKTKVLPQPPSSAVPPPLPQAPPSLMPPPTPGLPVVPPAPAHSFLAVLDDPDFAGLFPETRVPVARVPPPPPVSSRTVPVPVVPAPMPPQVVAPQVDASYLEQLPPRLSNSTMSSTLKPTVKVVSATQANKHFLETCFEDIDGTLFCRLCQMHVSSSKMWKENLKRHISGAVHQTAVSGGKDSGHQALERSFRDRCLRDSTGPFDRCFRDSQPGRVMCITCDSDIEADYWKRHLATPIHITNELVKASNKKKPILLQTPSGISCIPCGETFKMVENAIDHVGSIVHLNKAARHRSVAEYFQNEESKTLSDYYNDDILGTKHGWPNGGNLDPERNPKHAVYNFFQQSPCFPVQKDPLKPNTLEENEECRKRFDSAWTNVTVSACSVCGISRVCTEAKQMTLVSLCELQVLKHPSLTTNDVSESPYHVVAFNGIVYCVDPSLVAEDGLVPVCYVCKGNVLDVSPTAPAFSFVSGWDFGRSDVFARFQLPALTVTERSALCMALHFTTLDMIRHDKSFASTFKNHTISFPNTSPREIVIKRNEKIRVPSSEQRVFVLFVGERTKEQIVKERFRERYKIRWEVVARWIEFLMKHNAVFKHYAEIDAAAMERLKNINMEDIILGNSAVAGSDIAASALLADEQVAAAFERSESEFVMLKSKLQDPARDALDTIVEFMKENQKKQAVPMAGETELKSRVDLSLPYNEFTDNDLIVVGGMPHLFPCVQETSLPLLKKPLGKKVSHLLLQHDQRWIKDANFGFLHFNQMRRHCLNSTIASSEKRWNKGKKFLEDPQIAKKLTEAENLLKGLREGKISPSKSQVREAKILIDDVSDSLDFICSEVPFSNASRKKKIHDMLATQVFMGYPALFITISPCDHDVQLTVTRIANGVESVHTELIKNLSKRMAALQEHPGLAAESFDLLMDAVIEHLFGIEANVSNKTKKSCFGEESWGIFGPARGLFGVVEAQGRGSLHLHALLWGSAVTDFVSQWAGKKQETENAVAYMDSVTCTQLPTPCELPPGYRVGLEKCPPSDGDLEDIKKRDHACAKQMVHVHHINCFKTEKYEDCRYAYPREAVEKSGLYEITKNPDETEIIKKPYCEPRLEIKKREGCFGYPAVDTRPLMLLTQRSLGCENVAEYNPFLSRILACNCNVQLLGCQAHAAMVMFYLVKYLTKPLTKVSSAVAAVRHAKEREKFGSKSERENATLTVMCNRLGNHQLGLEEISAQMAMLLCLGHKAERGSHKIVGTNVQALFQYSKRGTELPSRPTDSSEDDDSSNTDAASANGDDIFIPDDCEPDEHERRPLETEMKKVLSRQTRVSEFGVVIQNAAGEPQLSLASEHFYYRGKELEFMNLYMYRAIVHTEKLKVGELNMTTDELNVAATGVGRKSSRRIRFAEGHSLGKEFVQVISSKYSLPSPMFVQRWSEAREKADQEKRTAKWRAGMKAHARYFAHLFVPFSPDVPLDSTPDGWKSFIGKLQRESAGLQTTCPWPRAVCIVLLGIINRLRLGIKDDCLEAPRKIMSIWRYANSTTKTQWFESLTPKERERQKKALEDSTGEMTDEAYAAAIREAQEFVNTIEPSAKVAQRNAENEAAMDTHLKTLESSLLTCMKDTYADEQVQEVNSLTQTAVMAPDACEPEAITMSINPYPFLSAIDRAAQCAADEIKARENRVGRRPLKFDEEQKSWIIATAKKIAMSNPTAGGVHVLLHGGPGTGKSECTRCLIGSLERFKPKSMLSAAAYGAAAENVGGRTLTSLLKIPFPTKDEGIGARAASMTPLKTGPLLELEKQFEGKDTLFIDEISCVGTGMLHRVHARCCEIKRNKQPFGGMNIVAVGDFFQLPPIGDTSLIYGRKTTGGPCESLDVDDFDFFNLTTQHRAAGESELASLHRKILCDLRDPDKCEGAWRIFLKMLRGKSNKDMFGKEGLGTVLVSSVKEAQLVSRIRSAHFAKLTGEYVYVVKIHGTSDPYLHVPGKPAISTENRPADGLVNGTSLREMRLQPLNNAESTKIRDFIRGEMNAKPAGGLIDLTKFKITGIIASLKSDQAKEFHFGKSSYGDKRNPHQLQCGFSYTLHKVQGTTLDDAVALVLHERPKTIRHLFTCSALYVALSRVRQPELLFALPEEIQDHSWNYIVKLKPNQEVVSFVVNMSKKMDGDQLARTKPEVPKNRVQSENDRVGFEMFVKSNDTSRPVKCVVCDTSYKSGSIKVHIASSLHCDNLVRHFARQKREREVDVDVSRRTRNPAIEKASLQAAQTQPIQQQPTAYPLDPNSSQGRHDKRVRSPVMPPVNFGPPLQLGLRNLGNTCFLNSILQGLFAVFAGTLFSHLDCVKPEFLMLRSLTELFLVMHSESSVAAITDLHGRFVESFPMFQGQGQHDACEALQSLINQMHEELLVPTAVIQTSEIPSFVRSPFRITMVSTVVCSECNRQTQTVDHTNVLAVGIDGSTLGSCFKYFMEPETLEGSQAYECLNCGKQVTATKTLEPATSNIVVAQLKRFHYDETKAVYVKSHKSIQIPQKFVFAKRQYTCRAVVHHIGEYGFGHYTCEVFLKNDEKNVVVFSDETVTRRVCEEKSITSYLAFYELSTQSPAPPPTEPRPPPPSSPLAPPDVTPPPSAPPFPTPPSAQSNMPKRMTQMSLINFLKK